MRNLLAGISVVALTAGVAFAQQVVIPQISLDDVPLQPNTNLTQAWDDYAGQLQKLPPEPPQMADPTREVEVTKTRPNPMPPRMMKVDQTGGQGQNAFVDQIGPDGTDQTGSNVAEITQQTDALGAVADVIQIGVGNLAEVNQFTNDGSTTGDYATITQDGTDNDPARSGDAPNKALITQTNRAVGFQPENQNKADIQQGPEGPGGFMGAGDVPGQNPQALANTAEIDQAGRRNEAKIVQDEDPEAPSRLGTSRNEALIVQRKTGNRAGIMQNMDDNDASIRQDGLENVAETNQTGEFNLSRVEQIGDMNENLTDQKGEGNQEFTYQDGTFNQAETIQLGNDNMAVTWQFGIENMASTEQLGNDNMSDILQDGDFNMAEVNQLNDNNVSRLEQLGNNNGFVVMQDGNDWSNVQQSGNSNIVSINQQFNP